MSRKLKPEERAKSVPKPTEAQVHWVVQKFQSGHAPKSIRDSLNFAQAKSPEFLKNLRGQRLVPAKGYNPYEPISSHNRMKGWEELSGQRPLSLTEVRRITDRVRKESKYREANKHRLDNLEDYRRRDLRRQVQVRYTGEKPWRIGQSRADSDAALVWRYAVSEEELAELEALSEQIGADLSFYSEE
jgi:hypothetical protein